MLDEAARASLINVNRWFRTIINQKPVKDILGEVQFAAKVPGFDSKCKILKSIKN